jgi:hypothetical protein
VFPAPRRGGSASCRWCARCAGCRCAR